jgi:predicted ATPase
VLVLGTYRVEEGTGAIADLGARPYTREVLLGTLDEPIVRALICDMLAIDAPPAAFVKFLARHSEGNPFFVAEYLRTATAEGLIRRTENRRLRLGDESGSASTDSGDVDALHLPLTMRELIARRLDGLSPIARALAACGSVLGRELDPDVLRDAARLDDAAAMEGTAELIARQVLEPTDQGGLRFVHDKLWEIAYERQDEADRRVRHADAARAIEERWQEPERARHYAALAHHYLTAQLEDRAIEYLDKRGRAPAPPAEPAGSPPPSTRRGSSIRGAARAGSAGSARPRSTSAISPAARTRRSPRCAGSAARCRARSAAGSRRSRA